MGESFVVVEPEASGWSTTLPSGAVAPVFDYWLGDDVVSAVPLVLVTERVRVALEALAQPTGFTVTPAHASASPFYERHAPGRALPGFWALDVRGEPGRDDMGMTPAGKLVVSRRILDVFLAFRIGRAVLAQYAPEGSAMSGEPDQASAHVGRE